MLFRSKVSKGWNDETGKLDEMFQVIPNNDYYQNLSYSIKSPIEFEKFINPVNRLVHVSGLKNFGDLQIENKSKNNAITNTSNQTIVLDVFNERRVDTINDFLFVTDYDPLLDENGNEIKSRFLKSSKSLIDYIKCVSNRVLPLDDITKKFANKEENNRKLYTDLYNILESDVYLKYLIQTIDGNNNYSLSEVVVLVKNDNLYTFQRSDLTNNSSNTLATIGDFYGIMDEFGQKVFRFVPKDPYDIDYEIGRAHV